MVVCATGFTRCQLGQLHKAHCRLRWAAGNQAKGPNALRIALASAALARKQPCPPDGLFVCLGFRPRGRGACQMPVIAGTLIRKPESFLNLHGHRHKAAEVLQGGQAVGILAKYQNGAIVSLKARINSVPKAVAWNKPANPTMPNQHREQPKMSS